MGEKLIVGPFNRGLRNDRPPFMIDNESFPTLINAYQWRGRIKRKRGTEFLCRLQRFFNSTSITYNPIPPGSATITFDGLGNANLLTGFTTLQTNASIVPGSVTIIASGGPTTYTDPTMDGFLTPTGTGGPNTINYATGAIHIPAQAGNTATATFSYYPALPVMGLEDLILSGMQFPGTMAFDTVYSYIIQTAMPNNAYDVSFYKNPPGGIYPGYIQKTNWTPVTWNGQDYQQFWTTNYQGALWATNGITQPFSTTNIRMQFAPATSIVYVSNTPTTIVVNIAASPLVVGDFVFFNEWTGVNAATLNFQTGYVTMIAGANITITLPNATLGAGPYVPGIIQYLTTRSDVTKDNIRFFDGDPTNGSSTVPTFIPGNGWVNFMPPLSQFNYTISDQPLAQYYLVGARMILPYKDRLLFFGPVIQTSTGNPIYLQDTIIYSQNGTPYYTASWTGNIFKPIAGPVQTGFMPLLVPTNQTATPNSFWEDQTGFGGWVSAALDRAITTVSTNEDALIVGFDSNVQTRVIYSGNDIVPFNFYIINAEMGSSSTFSAINMDFGVITKGNRGYIITSQTEVQRIDLEIPDEVFETRLTTNGTERVCAQRDFINEWIYFTYPSNLYQEIEYKFPTKTLQYNYRDQSWGIFFESYTTYGSFRRQTGYIWSTIGNKFRSWEEWTDPWLSGDNTLEQPLVIAGNQQGYVLIRAAGISEATSLFIKSFSGNIITCPDHCLKDGDFILITGALGTISQFVNNFVFQVTQVTENTFVLPALIGTGTYLGLGQITRIYIPQIQTKQFPTAWELARKTRIGPQQYLFSTTTDGQITLQIFLSQNAASPYTDQIANPNSSLVYTQVLYTCPESTNLGLLPASTNMANPANTNLQMVTAAQQAQIWHRMNTSLIGDTVQIGFTVSDDQILALDPTSNVITITGITNAYPAVLTVTTPFFITIGSLVKIQGVQGMTQLNGNTYNVIAKGATTITIDVDTTTFGVFTPMTTATATQVYYANLFNEIEMHGFILDVQPSQVLA